MNRYYIDPTDPYFSGMKIVLVIRALTKYLIIIGNIVIARSLQLQLKSITCILRSTLYITLYKSKAITDYQQLKHYPPKLNSK